MYKSEAEINKVFDDHLDSLKWSGIEYNVAEIEQARAEVLEEFRNPTD